MWNMAQASTNMTKGELSGWLLVYVEEYDWRYNIEMSGLLDIKL